jgi:osmotically-inducible protein OsmY
MPNSDDTQMHQAVVVKLGMAANLDAQGIEVAAQDGYIVLSGHVPSPTESWLATETADGVDGVKDVANNLRVRPTG